jgi:hypothetical protein
VNIAGGDHGDLNGLSSAGKSGHSHHREDHGNGQQESQKVLAHVTFSFLSKIGDPQYFTMIEMLRQFDFRTKIKF